MSKVFDDIVNGGYFVGFGGLTPEQESCKQLTRDNLDALLHVRQREKFVKEVRVCCCGYGESDEDEPLEDNNFSQFQFYLPYTNDLIFFHDKFDFLIKCVAHGVCKIESGFEERFASTLLQVLTFRDTTIPQSPEFVLDLRTQMTPRTVGEVPRTFEENQLLIDSYVHKRNGYAEKLRMELEQLEAEQYEAERQRGEHKSVMGWSNPNTPRGDGAIAVAPQQGAAVADEDASIARIKSAIELAREEAKEAEERETAAREKKELDDQELIASYMQNGGTASSGGVAAEPKCDIPVINMLLQMQEEQIRQEQQAKLLQDERERSAALDKVEVDASSQRNESNDEPAAT
jgi:hypothetical protein